MGDAGDAVNDDESVGGELLISYFNCSYYHRTE
jgi:hypothetical protein